MVLSIRFKNLGWENQENLPGKRDLKEFLNCFGI